MSDQAAVPSSAPIVIVGAGLIGLSIAFHLAERGMSDVVIIERDAIASGSSAKATGGIRQQFATETNIAMSVESVSFFKDFAARVGAPFDFRQNGYLFLISDQAQLTSFVESVSLQRSMGVPTEVLSVEEIERRFPAIETRGLIGATFCPTDGSGSPADVAYALAERSRRLGVRILEDTALVSVDCQAGKIAALKTTHGVITTDTLIDAAGPWSPLIADMVGVALPITAHPRQVFSLSPVAELGEDVPFTVDMQSGVYIHQERNSILLGGGDRDRPSGYEALLDWTRFESVVEAIVNRIPVLADAESISGWCGLRDMTPDDHPIIGPVEDVDGFWCAAGFSGHGFMHAPAAGRILSEWILDGSPTGIDTRSLSLDRFSSPASSTEAVVF